MSETFDFQTKIIPIGISKKNDNDLIHNFDNMLNEFLNIFENKIEYKKNDEIILNITSGTPQIITALCVLYITKAIKCKNVKIAQVNTPEKSHNHPTKLKYYPYQSLWLMNLDNENMMLSDCRIVYPKLNLRKEVYFE